MFLGSEIAYYNVIDEENNLFFDDKGDELIIVGNQASFNAFDLINKNLAAGVKRSYIAQDLVANQLIDNNENFLN
jgi:hypothetical protein